MRCGHCGEPLPTGALFCGECGRAVQASAPATPRTARVSMVTPIMPPPPSPNAQPIAAPPPVAPPRPDASSTVIIEPLDVVEPVEQAEPVEQLEPVETADPAVTADRVAPQSAPVPVAADLVEELDEDADPGIDDDPTIVARRRVVPDPVATLIASSGQHFQIGGRVLLGRRPTPAPGEFYDAVLVVLDDGKTISKTHLELVADEHEILVIDLGSGNGTVIETPGSPPLRCEAGVPHPVPRGSRLVLGRQFLVIA